MGTIKGANVSVATVPNDMTKTVSKQPGQRIKQAIEQLGWLIMLNPWLPLCRAAYQYTIPVVPPCRSGGKIIPQDKIISILFEHATALIDDETDAAKAISRTREALTGLFCSCNY